MSLKAFSVATALKLVLIPAYKSTDFEVHRNWMAITYSLPIKEWYTESTSEWTIDYPPFFAWFEYLLSLVAYYFDKNMLNVQNLNYSSDSTRLFMRLSVIFTDLILACGCREVADYLTKNPIRKSSRWKSLWSSPVAIFYMLVLNNMGLFIVDHIHFQYNGVLFGILLLSIGKILKGNYVWGAFWFSILINMKHIFLYMAPAYGIYTLKNYCFMENGRNLGLKTAIGKMVKLGTIVIFITSLSFGPFVFYGQLPQVLSRLFPFKRGLCHTYWAPNIWALYNIGDKVLVAAANLSPQPEQKNVFMHYFQKFLSFIVNKKETTQITCGSMTSGVLQNYEHVLLPLITPTIAAVLVFTSILPCLVKLWTSPGNPLHFVRSVVICTSCAFLFGWHVHEKAILMVIIPLSVMAVLWRKEAEVYILMSAAGHFSLLPLVFTPHEFLIKVIMFVMSAYYVITVLSDLFEIRSHSLFPTLNIWENLYIFGLIFIFIYEHILQHIVGFDKRYPFLPLLLTSSYCALGITYCTLKYYYNFLRMHVSEHKQKTF